jgi:hypothetical protein
MKRIIAIVLSLVLLGAIGVLVLRSCSAAPKDWAVESSEIPIPEAFQPLDVPDDREYADAGSESALQALAERIDSLMDGLLLPESADTSMTDGAVASLGLLATGDVEAYSAYRDAFACSLGPTAEPLANQRFKAHGLPDIDQKAWDAMSPQQKFDAVAANPDHRNATILKCAPAHAKAGLGERNSLPMGYRIQGLLSAYRPATPGLLGMETPAEWSWVEIPVKLEATDEAILRFEYVRDPGVNAWILVQASLLAPESAELAWIVF